MTPTTMPIHRFLGRTAVLAVVSLLAVCSCSGASKDASAVSAADLQKGLVDRLAQTDTPSTWIHCPKDLPGKVGAVARCDVTFSQTNTVTAVVTATQVKGDAVTWEITQPELTKEQVTARVAGLVSAQSVVCDGGLTGRPGDWVECQVTKNGGEIIQTVEVKDVVGLALDLALTQVIPREQVEESVVTRLTARYGRRPDKAECTGGLQASVGAAVKCSVTVGDNVDNYVARVQRVSGVYVDYLVAKPGELAPGIDLCDGCPG